MIARSAHPSPDPLGVAVAALLAGLALAACGGRPAPAPPPGDGAPAAPAGPVGRLVTIAARADGDNEAAVLDLATGAREALWTTGPEIADWRVAADGARAAYRAAIRSPRAAESLEVRELVADATPRVAASVDPAIERIAGHAFAADGAALLYVRQAVSPAGGVALWLVGAAPGDEARPASGRVHRVLAAGDGRAPALALTLVAWSSRTDRAVLREDAPDGGPVLAARFSAAEGTGDARSPAPSADAALAAAPDASAVAWLPRDGGPVVVDDGAAARAVAPGGAGWPALPLFDPTGSTLAWQVNPEGGGAAWVQVVDVRAGSAPRELRLPDESLQPLAFAPDGARLLLGAGPPDALDPARLVVADVATGALTALPWPPPEGLWGAAWVPAP